MTIAERQDPFLGTRLVLIAATTTECRIESVRRDGVEQGHRLQPVSAGPRAGVLDDTTVVDRGLHTGHHQPRTDALDEPISVLDDFGKVVTGVDVHDRKWQPGRGEGEHGEMQQHRRVLAATEQQHGILALRCNLANDRDGFVSK
jgi:hypothetical protein